MIAAVDPQRHASELERLIARLGAETAGALQAIAEAAPDELLDRLDARDRTLAEMEPHVVALRGLPRGGPEAEARAERWLAPLRRVADALRESETRLQIALVAERDELREELAQLDAARVRQGRYRVERAPEGARLDLTR